MPETLYDPVGPAPDFLVTKEHRRFAEFVEACRRERYIGLCHGAPGVGKTISARHCAHWDTLSPHLSLTVQVHAALHGTQHEVPTEANTSRTVFWTPTVGITPRQLSKQLAKLCDGFNLLVERALEPETEVPELFRPDLWNIELLIVDEADRLKTPALEQLRDFFDRHDIGLVLIGMPGIERKLARYPQLYSRIGFAHRYNTLSPDELQFVLAHHWERLGLTLSADDFTDAEAIATVARITGGNFRLVHRLFSQIRRIVEINQLETVTSEVVEAARETLVIGTT